MYPDKIFDFDIIVNEKDMYFTDCAPQFVVDSKTDTVKFNIAKMDYEKAFLRKEIDQYIQDYSIIIFLDIPNLYSRECRLERKELDESIYEARQYEELYSMLTKEDIVLPKKSRTLPIHYMLSALNTQEIGQEEKGTNFRCVLNDALISYIQREMKKRDGNPEYAQRKDFHILFSSTSSLANSPFVYNSVVREERYKGKAFRLLSSKSHANMQKYLKRYENGKKNWICFSLWNMVKNIDIELFDADEENDYSEMIKEIKEKRGIAPKLLSDIYVKLQWSSGFKEFRYWIDFSGLEKNGGKQEYIGLLKELVDNMFWVILQFNASTLGNCVLNSFCNTIYSQIQCIEDAVFYCLFRTRNWEVIRPKVEYAGEFQIKKGEAVFSGNMPDRWIHVRTINEFQKPVVSREQYDSVVYEMQKNNYDVGKLLYDIYEICGGYGYDDSRLYYNVCQKLGMA